jgi:NADPH-dependent glutamate synthase beta subunit-like oxidoreductase/NAD-dependent dihydropyrimidine dehydrogenase PreA subunit
MMKDKKDRLHKVMVLGATPAGISAVNKLGELGIPVTLVDTEADIDHKLRKEEWRLSSGVPLNYAHRPGLLRILRNPRITCILPGEVTAAKHCPQGFSVTVRPGATYVDKDRCLLCGKCEDICPVTTRDGNKAVSAGNRMSLPGRAVIDKRRMPLCQAGCPLGVNVQAYVALTRAGKYREALAMIRKDNVLPSVCGRICTHPCEAACRRADVDGAVSVRAIKRYLAEQEDKDSENRWAGMKPSETHPEKIAVIGSGPAGLAAAAELARHGFSVTVFEKEEKIGGMLQYGIGEHRLPRDVLDKEIEAIKGWGVQFKTGSAVDLKKDLKNLTKKYKAVLLATGTWKDRTLGVPGEDLSGVGGCIDFLTAHHRGEAILPKGKIAVIGDGNAAFDLARTLVRLGGDVTLISWFPRDMITADEEEVKGALEEGVKCLYSHQTLEFKGKKGKLTALSLSPTRPGEKDAKGIAWPVPVENAEPVEKPFDAAFVAVGQVGPLDAIYDFSVSERGTITADETFRTGLEGVYAAGDAVTGPASVVYAMAQGRNAAGSVVRDITGKTPAFMDTSVRPARPAQCDFPAIPEGLETIGRADMQELPPAERSLNFHEVCKGLSPSQTALESERCLQCGVCSQCLECVEACGPAKAIQHNQTGEDTVDHVGVLIVADPTMASRFSRLTGDDVIRAYGPASENNDVYSMMIRGFAAAAQAMEMLSG